MQNFPIKNHLLFTILFMFSLIVVSNVHADLGAVGQKAQPLSAVAFSIRSAGDVAASASEFKGIMDEYDQQREKCKELKDTAEIARCNERLRSTLDRARDILKKLNQQADLIESRISTVSSLKPANSGYMKKVDSVLASVREMRMEANRRMEEASRSI